MLSVPLDTSQCRQSLYTVPIKRLRIELKTELPRTFDRCICSQKNEMQQRKPVIEGIRNKKKKKKKKFIIPYNTKIWQKMLHQKMSAVSRI